MRVQSILCLLIAIALASTAPHAQTVGLQERERPPADVERVIDERERPALDAYRAGDLESASSTWRALLEAPDVALPDAERARLCYNLGNVAFRGGSTLEAVGWYTAALRLRPRDGDTWANLEHARSEAKLEPADRGDLSATSRRLLTALTPAESEWLVIGALAAWGVLLAGEALRGGRLWRALAWSGALGVLVAAGPLAYHAFDARTDPVLAIAAGTLEVHSEPRAGAAVIGAVPRGTCSSGWTSCRTGPRCAAPGFPTVGSRRARCSRSSVEARARVSHSLRVGPKGVGPRRRCGSEFSCTTGARHGSIACAALPCATACGPRPSDAPHGRGVLVIAIDALRADHLSASGYDRETTPVLDGLAAQGLAFEQVFATSPELLPAHAALLTGCDPTLARRTPLAVATATTDSSLSDWRIPDAVPRLAQEFLAQGFATAAFVDHPMVAPVCGFGAGFQEFFTFRTEAVLARKDHAFEIVGTRFLNWLTSQAAQEDWFAYVHTNDLERLWRRPESDPQWDTFFEPREELAQVPPVSQAERIFFAVPRSSWSGGTSSLGEYEARYDGALRHLDGKLGRLLEGMRRKDRLKNTTVIVVGTYGMSFGESGLILDSGTLSDPDLRVPIVCRPSPEIACARGKRIAHLASTLDVAPTLMDLLGLPIPRGMQGVSHAPAMRGASVPPRTLAFACGGLQAGFTAFDERWCYEQSTPGRGERGKPVSPLSIAWYGDEIDHRDEQRVFLHDRHAGRAQGHLTHSALEPHAAAGAAAAGEAQDAAHRLRAAAEDWYAWAERARDLLQRAPAAEGAHDAATLAELERRGWLDARRLR